MDQGVALFPEYELIALQIELSSGGSTVNWTLLKACCRAARL